ncbi:bifunctional diguanylate cyclase/phosphodiesterase [Micromonospora sp. NPDC049559]|uniref:putative bifunctional diguanylate cyclase/phosphodiesterase n=1 Tax=Micromonospora sp. NPDC049559 TaxID=3155923 RepID=UPI003415CA6A
MQIPSGTVAVVAASAAGALSGLSLLVVSARQRGGRRRQAHQLLAAGAGLATAGLLVGAIGMIAVAGHWDEHQSHRTGLATLVAVPMAVAGLLLCAGLLRLPGVAETGAAALRLVLDGLVVAAALWFVGWILLVEPTRLLGAATPASCAAIMLSAVTAVTAVGLTFMIGGYSARPRRGLAGAGLGVSVTAGGGLGLATGICQAGPVPAMAGAATLGAGLLLVAYASRRTDATGGPERDVIRQASGYAFLPMLAMVVSAAYHLGRGGVFTAPGVVAGSVEGFALVAGQYFALRDVRGYASRLAEREAHFRELAHTDPLTGLANRRGLLRVLHNEAGPDNPCVLLGLDLDGFKHVNDMRGHDVGDAVLVEVGQRLRGNLRPGDLAARLGGDEFAVLMWGRPPEAQRVAERLLGVLGRPYERPEGRIFLSVSIGLAGDPDCPDVESLLRHADLALRYAKQRGKNRVERYDVAYDQLLRRRTTVEHELRGAIGRDELRLVFQPVVAVPSVRPVGAEALLRWHHHELGNVGPDEFIPLAEECGMIAELGAWVLHQACHQLSRWLADGHDVWVSVNVSPRELHAPEYVNRVAEALRAHRVPPQRLVLEVTEHAVATDLDELIRRLGALRMTGVRIALDDFGAGYSSLGQLRRLPIDILKIDHSLVTEPEPATAVTPDGRPFAPMVDVVMRLGHQLGLEVIAEGVTNPTELSAVVDAGCRFGQGQLFGWGVPAEHLEAMLEAASSPAARPVPVPRPDATPGTGPTSAARGDRDRHPSPARGDRDRQERPGVDRLGADRPGGDRPGADRAAQDVGSVDSSREMRQA